MHIYIAVIIQSYAIVKERSALCGKINRTTRVSENAASKFETGNLKLEIETCLTGPSAEELIRPTPSTHSSFRFKVSLLTPTSLQKWCGLLPKAF